MKGIGKRGFLYWTIETERLYGMLLGIVGFMQVLYYFMGMYDTLGEFLKAFSTYVVMCGVIFLFVYPATVTAINVPMTIAMGGLRSEAYMGVNWMNVLAIIETLGLSVILGVILEYDNVRWLPLELAGMLAASGAGFIGSIASVRFGKKGYIIVTLAMTMGVLLVMLGGVGVLFQTVSAEKFAAKIMELQWMACIPAVLFYLITALFYKRMLMKLEVRA